MVDPAPKPLRMVWPWLLLGVISLGSAGASWREVSQSDSTIGAASEVAWIGLAPLFGALGVVIMSKQRGNQIGHLLLLIGVGLGLNGVFFDLLGGGSLDLTTAPSALTPALFIRLWVENWSWVAAIFPIFLLLYVFPTGSLPSRRWIWAPRLMVAMAAIMIGMAAFSPEIGPINEEWLIPNPVGFIGPGVIDLILGPWAACLFALAAGGVAAMVLRYRRGTHEEKSQFKLVLLAVAVFGAVYLMELTVFSWAASSSLTGLLMPIAVGGIPVSITIAILRYRLFDIDVIISRSLAYGSLAVFIGAVYVGMVVGIGELLDQRGSAGLSIAATSLVALAFQPMRVRVERFANRLVYGERATPYEVLAQFSRQSAEESDEELLARIPRLMVGGTGASAAALWVRAGDGFRAASTWPADVAGRVLEGGAVFTDPEADFSLPVFHDQELLGGLSLTKGRGETITPAEAELLANLAGGLGLALRNTMLTAQLRQQVKDLKRSRDRIVNAADEARRSLEHDLDSGPQQQLVAVKVKLGPTRVLAEKAGASQTARILTDIEAQAGDAIRAVREFAAGIYPPLLGAEGLAVALGHEVRRAALPIAVHADGIGRYPREVEAAVYFTVLEALQNTAKHADASAAEVNLTEHNGDLLFEVRDDGRGFDTAGLRAGIGLSGSVDRLDTVGGSWSITSQLGSGTVVSGLIPVREKGAINQRPGDPSVGGRQGQVIGVGR